MKLGGTLKFWEVKFRVFGAEVVEPYFGLGCGYRVVLVGDWTKGIRV